MTRPAKDGRTAGPWRVSGSDACVIERTLGPEHPGWNEEAIQCHSREQAEEFVLALNSNDTIQGYMDLCNQHAEHSKTLRADNARLREALTAMRQHVWAHSTVSTPQTAEEFHVDALIEQADNALKGDDNA